MKARTRFLAMLLTVLMVGGLLPLSLFAADSASGTSLSDAVQMKPVDRTFENIKEEFAKKNYNLSAYQTFEGWEYASGESSYVFPTGSEAQVLTTYMDFRTGSENQLNMKNSREAFSIKTEANGNKAFYIGSAPKVESYADNYIDFNHGLPNSYEKQAGNGSHDLFVSVDLKMEGANISETFSTGLFGVLYRLGDGAGASIVTTVSLSAVGGIYIGASPSADGLVGFLSDKEYTRIALEISRADNKFYVYINDVLVNPKGNTLFSEDVVDAMNNSDKKANTVTYTASNMPICNFRMFNYNTGTSDVAHKGLWVDNLLMGTRIAVNPISTPFKDLFTSHFTDNLVGQGVTTPIPGTTNAAGNGVIWPGSITYVRDVDGEVAMQWHKMPADSSTTNDQAYFNLNNNAAKGSNLRLSMDLMLGADGCVGNTGGEGFFFFRSERASKSRETNFSVQLSNAGVITCDKVTIGTLTKTEYHNLTVDIVCNAISGSIMALVFFDGELKHTKTITINYAGADEYNETDFHPNMIRFYNIYDGGVANLKDNDLIMKNLSYSVTTDYNGSSSGAPFQKTAKGFVTNAGLSYYYDAEGKIKGDTFELDGEKYIVGYAGNIICKESDGEYVTPYAPYVAWDHLGDLLHSSVTGNFISGSADNGKGVVGPDRDSFSSPAVIPGLYDTARLYTSYYVPSTDGNDNNSYAQWDIDEALMTNSSLVLDFDIMMAASARYTDKSPEWHSFFYFVGNDAADGTGNRIDTALFDLDSDGWFRNGDQKLFKVNQTEFTRFSFVITTPSGGEANGSVDVYANGVLVLENVPLENGVKSIQQLRFFNAYDQDLACYVRDAALYEGTAPQKFYTKTESGIELIDNPNDDDNTENDKAPVKASDLKKGFIVEDSVVRYYGENGLVVAARSGLTDFSAAGDYKADVNGVVYTVNNTEAEITVGDDYTVDFTDVKSGIFGYASFGTADELFNIKFNSNYFAYGQYTDVKFDIYLPAGLPTGQYAVGMGEGERFYKIEWVGENNFKLTAKSYLTEMPEGAVMYEEDYNLENARGGETAVYYVDNDDIVGLSVNDTFYVRTENMQLSALGDFADLTEGWNTIEAPIVDNGIFGIDTLQLITENALDVVYVKDIRISAVKLSKTVKFMMNDDAADGVSADGYYYKGGIAQIGWIDENNSEDVDAGDYYVSADNAKIVTGIYSVDGVWYEFAADGKLVGKADGVKYVMNGFNKFGTAISAYKKFENGVLVIGLVEIDVDGTKVFLYTNENGVAAQNTVAAMQDGAVYSFDVDGYGTVLCADADAHVYGDPVMIKAATCKATGTKEYTCTVCGSKKQEEVEIDPSFHAEYNDKGIATCCTGDVKADGVTSVYGYSIAIGKSVSVVFYVDVTGTVGEIEVGRRSAFIGNTTEKIAITDLEDVTIGDKTYKKVSVDVAPTELDAIVIIRYVREDGLYGSSYEYRVREYLDAVAARPDEDEVFTAEVKAVVNAFTVYADNVHNVITGEGNVDKITDVDETTFTSDYDVQWGSNQKNEQNGYIKLDKTYENISYVYEDTIKIKVCFTLTGVIGDFKFFVNGKEVNAELTDGGLYAVKVEVNASQLDDLIVITVTHISGAELALRTSAVAIAKRMYMSNNTTDDEKNLMRAIYKYDQAIDAYLASIAPAEAE